VSEADRSTALQQGTREFAGVYERNAYLVYNLALRITADKRAAIDAAQSAFLASLNSADQDAELPKLTVQRALSNAKSKPTPEAAGDSDARAMLRATAALPAPERAALALSELSKSAPVNVAAVLDVTEDAAASLLERAWSGFSQAASLSVEAAQEMYRGWLWAEPPGELWEQLYPSFYAQLVRRLNEAEAAEGKPSAVVAAVAAAAPKPSRRERRRARQAEKDARRARRPGLVRRTVRAIPVGRLVLLALVGAAGTGVAYAAGVFGTHTHVPTVGIVTAPTHKLSPKEIAKLRAEEQAASRAYAAQQRQAAKQAMLQQALELKAMQQQRAQQAAVAKAAAQAAAQRQAAALKQAKQFAAQQQALQKQLLLQQQQQQQQAATTPTNPYPYPYPYTTQQPKPKPKRQSNPNGSSTTTSPSSTQAQQQCLYNANNGTYVCPQGG
jgi:DNA-directed RNA polymerase specialized sigma24 family protein